VDEDLESGAVAFEIDEDNVHVFAQIAGDRG
jgi:hypothetical protein